MDYKKYIEFVLAIENPSSKPAFDFFWKILDVQNDGFLTPFIIKMFYREVQVRRCRSAIGAAICACPLTGDFMR